VKSTILWVVRPCSSEKAQRFGRASPPISGSETKSSQKVAEPRAKLSASGALRCPKASKNTMTLVLAFLERVWSDLSLCLTNYALRHEDVMDPHFLNLCIRWR
jgi:hypothetical protein